MNKSDKPKKKPPNPKPSAVTKGTSRPIVDTEQNGKITRRKGSK